MTETVYINGEYLAKENAKISIFDRGFIFGDGIYEVVPILNGRMADRQYFLDRLRRSLGELQINFCFSDADLISILNKLIKINRLKEGIVYLQITRGIAERDFIFDETSVYGSNENSAVLKEALAKLVAIEIAVRASSSAVAYREK